MNVEHQVAASAQSDKIDGVFAEYVWVPADNELASRSKGGMVTVFLILCVCCWSVSETWAAFGRATDNIQLFALLVAKLIWLLVGGAAIYDIRTGKIVFAFLCGVSVVGVASALPSVYMISKMIFILLLVECLLKALCLIVLGGGYLMSIALGRAS
jgi:hypothetical protein